MTTKAIVFDFDGVVLESGSVKTQAFLDLFAGHPPETLAKIRAHHIANLGISRFKKFAWIYEHILRTPLSDQESRLLGEKFSRLVMDAILVCPYVPGAREALEALWQRLPLFVASGAPHEELAMVVERRGLSQFFREIWGTPREKPAIIVDILDRYRLRPNDVLFIGDGESDYRAAMTTSVRFLARDTEDLAAVWTKLGVDRVTDLTGLVALVERT